MARVSIAEFGIIQKQLAGALVTFYLADEAGEKTETKAELYQSSTGAGTRANPQTLDANGQLEAECFVEAPVMAEITNITENTDRSIRKIRQNPIHYALPVTSAKAQLINPLTLTIVGGTINGVPIGGSTPAAGTFTALACSSLTETSDERLKTNVAPLHEAASKLLALKPVVYNRKATKSNTREELGFIAQQVREVIPGMVAEDKNGYLSLHYLDLLALLVKGFQESAECIVDLTKRINALEGK